MSRDIFPFILLDKSRDGIRTTLADMEPLAEQVRDPLTTQRGNIRDFRPTSPGNRMVEKPELIVEGGRPKVLSATVDAASSLSASTDSPPVIEESPASVTKESKEGPASDGEPGTTVTGSEMLLVPGSILSDEASPTSSSPQS